MPVNPSTAPLQQKLNTKTMAALTAVPTATKQKQKEKIPVAKLLKLYVLPIVTLVLFGIIWLVLIFPSLGGIFSILDEMASTKAAVEEKQALVIALQELQSNIGAVSNDLSLINQTAPVEATKVVEFQQKISGLATQNGLTVLEASTENQELVLEENVSEALAIIEIPSKFIVRGNFNAIKTFIEAIEGLEDFVIIGEMQLQASAEIDASSLASLYSQQWTLNIDLIKYQFLEPDEENELQQAYARVPVDVLIDEEVMTFVREKYGE